MLVTSTNVCPHRRIIGAFVADASQLPLTVVAGAALLVATANCCA